MLNHIHGIVWIIGNDVDITNNVVINDFVGATGRLPRQQLQQQQLRQQQKLQQQIFNWVLNGTFLIHIF
jgi:hypothetical protein